jgi:deazaflavin-dependent oxidoreductase (nitroreductase family)
MATTIPSWLRVVFAAPNGLYRYGMGRVFGRRFLQLTHVGRKTGVEHSVVLEVLRYDRDTGEAVVISGFGEGSQWLRNLRANREAWISFGRTTRRAELRELDVDEAVDVMAHYEQRYGMIRPVLRRVLSALGGFEYHGTDEDRRRLVAKLPLIAFRPA